MTNLKRSERTRCRTVILALVVLAIVLSLGAKKACAFVTILSPNDGATLSGVVTINATVTNDWWSQLVVDGKPIVAAKAGTLTLTWDTTSVTDGVHELTVKGYKQGQTAADTARTISVNVLNTAPPPPTSVSILSPAEGATVTGTVTVIATVPNEWWSQVVLDDKPIASGHAEDVAVTWDTTTAADGSHTLTVKGYGQGQTVADDAKTIAISVSNTVAPSPSPHPSPSATPTPTPPPTPPPHFGTIPPGAPLPTGEWCAEVIPSEPEMVPANNTRNNTMPTAAELASYAANGYNANPYKGTWAYAMVDGHYIGTTDMIIRWASCKWGIDEDVVRAQTTTEHWSWDTTTAHGDKRTDISQCVNGNFDLLWNYLCPNCCYQTWSNWQTKVFYSWQLWPMIDTSTAFGADYRYADQRVCMNGDLAGQFVNEPSYNGHNYAQDVANGDLDTLLWGCIGAHYSGSWYDGDSTHGAIWYIDYVKGVLARKDWKLHWTTFPWPD